MAWGMQILPLEAVLQAAAIWGRALCTRLAAGSNPGCPHTIIPTGRGELGKASIQKKNNGKGGLRVQWIDYAIFFGFAETYRSMVQSKLPHRRKIPWYTSGFE